MTKEEAAKYVKEWVEYVEDPYAIPEVDQPCTGEEIIEAMKICADALSNSEPQELDEAAIGWIDSTSDGTYGLLDAFKAGAKWMAEQGVTIETRFTKTKYRGLIAIRSFHKDGEYFKNGEEVIVQIRKKED